MIDFKSWLFHEMHWQDIYPKSFKDFMKKYGKIVRQGEGYKYYVQFTNYANDVLIKNSNPNPDHSDPVGIYAYPLNYVVNHPGDIWYGRKAKYLRILTPNTNNILHITNLNKGNAELLLSKMGIDYHLLDFARKTYKHSGVAMWAKSFMSAVQMRLDQAPEIGDYGNKKYPMRSSLEQTQLFKKAGVDAILDTANRQTQASINTREPEQIVFLSRSSFKVIEIYNLDVKTPENNVLLADFLADKKDSRKIAAIIFESLDDKLVSGPVSANFGDYYWSAKGKRIYIYFNRIFDNNKKFGEKKHKEYKKHDDHQIIIKLEHSERGKLEKHYDNNVKISQIAQDMRYSWNTKQDDPEFKPETKEIYQTRKKQEEHDRIIAKLKKEDEDFMEETKELIPKLKLLANKLNLTFEPVEGTNYAKIITAFQRRFVNSNEKNKIKSLFNSKYNFGKDNTKFYELGYIPNKLAQERPDLGQLKNILIKMHKTIPDLNFRSSYAIDQALQDLNARDRS